MRRVFALLLLAACSDDPAGSSPEPAAPDLAGLPDLGSAADLAPPPPIDPLARFRPLVAAFAPTVYFHPDERYLPSSTEWFLSRATLHQGDAVLQAGPRELPTRGEGYYLTLPEAARGGDLPGALCYVHGKEVMGGRFIDLQFWLFYPYNGPGTLAINTPLKDFTVDLSPFGEHTGDWEHATVRIDVASGRPAAVYLSQHAGGEWVMDPQRVMEQEGGRPVIYASRNGHASYRQRGANLSESGGAVGFTYGLRNDTERGPKLDCALRHRLVQDDEAPLNFVGRWGPRIDNAPFLSQVADRFPSIAKPIIDKTLGGEQFSDGPTSPQSKSSWLGEE